MTDSEIYMQVDGCSENWNSELPPPESEFLSQKCRRLLFVTFASSSRKGMGGRFFLILEHKEFGVE
jgi:hypothetical protein